MSMKGPAGEETLTATCPKVEAKSTGDDSCQSASPYAAATAIKYEPTPLLRIFSSREIVPKILEYEKALLVMKEHDYAKSEDRPGILKLSSLLSVPPLPSEEPKEDAQAMDCVSTLLSTRKDLLQCRENMFERERNLISNHQREMIGMQIELIREQQEQLHDKDKELNTVRKDKEQLEARLERMERRLAILQKHSRSKYDNSELESPQPPPPQQQQQQQLPPANPTSSSSSSSSLTNNDSLSSETVVGITTSTPRPKVRRELLMDSDRHARSRSNSHDRGSRSNRSSRIPSHSGTPVPQDLQDSIGTGTGTGMGKRNKRKSSENLETSSSKKKKPKQNEMRTRLEYSGLSLMVSGGNNSNIQNLRPSGFTEKQLLSNHFDRSRCSSSGGGGGGGSGTSSNRSNSNINNADSANPAVVSSDMNGTDDAASIVVPLWRVYNLKASTEADGSKSEDLSDEVFSKRHKKPEEDEKRRKRWDMQRTRAKRDYEELLRKYNQKGGGGGGVGGDKSEKKKDKTTSLLPKLSEINSIEIRDSLPVTAFGMPVPLIKSKEFELPWFDLDAREAKESARKTRSSRTRGSASTTRLSVESSAEEDLK